MKKLNLTVAFLSLAMIIGAMGQNVSYKVNSVPISGTNNSAFGHNTLISVTTGANNVAVGYSALRYNTGSVNTAIGSMALFSNTTGSFNTANGFDALLNNTTGVENTANGSRALSKNIAGQVNTSNGFAALFNNTIGSFNTAVGSLALGLNDRGNHNVAIGESAGFNSLGDGNIYLGKRAGYYETGSHKIYIGNDSNRTIMYGDLATGQILIGKMQPTDYSFQGTRTLNVLGGLLADSVRISLSGNWADYVFKDDYALQPLGELEKFIRINKHLPNIPSAAEVAENGIELGDLQVKLLVKVEELTLYLLQQQKQMESQQREINDLKKKLKLK